MIKHGISKTATFTIEVTEKELATIISALNKPHTQNKLYAEAENLPHLNGKQESQLFTDLNTLLKEGAE